MSHCERAQAFLARIWKDSGLRLMPYERPIEPTAPELSSPPDSGLLVAPARINALLNMPPEGSESTNGDCVGKGHGKGRGGGRVGGGDTSKAAATKAPRLIPIGMSSALKSVLKTESVPVVKNLYRLGRADLRKRRPAGYLVTASVRISEGECGIGKKELQRIQRSQIFSDGRNRPAIVAHAINEWRAVSATLS